MLTENFEYEGSSKPGAPLPMTRIDDHLLRVAISTEHSSTFDVEFICRLAATVQKIRDDESVRAVILTGGSTYFSAGASQAALGEIEQERNILYRALEIPRLLLDIPVPTLAAMGGHAIGGGFMIGMWCDMQVLAEECRYGMNAVKLGVPPVMGATEILSDVIGASLAGRLLYTGRLVKGRFFQRTGSGLAASVLPKDDVWPQTLALAQDVAEAPRGLLALAKRQLIMRRQAMLARVADAEMAMLQTVLNQHVTRQRIAESYPVPLNT